MSVRSVAAGIALLIAGAVPCVASGQSGLHDEIDQLRKQVAAQQQQIDELRELVRQQSKLLGGMVAKPAQSEPTPESKSTPVAAARVGGLTPDQAAAVAAPRGNESARSPLAIGVGPLLLTPTGFIEYTQVWRSRTVTSGLPTNFAAVPFNNTVEGNRRQTLSTAANSRLGVQLDATFPRMRLLGVVETDFLGYQPGNLATTTNSYGLRLRLAFADVQLRKWEFLAGQDWTLLTPARKGIPAVPSGLMLTQDLDPNIQSGLVWARSPQFRAVYRPKAGIAIGASVEAGDAYVGGSSGAGAITLPTALAPNYFNQVDLGNGGSGVPSPHLDAVVKTAFDWKPWNHATHVEIAGILNQFEFFNPLTNQHFSTVGGGGSINAGFDLTRKLTLLTANYYSDGGGRLIYGEAPALIIEGNGAPSLIHSMSTIQGLEYQAGPMWKMWAYYGGTYIDKYVAIDPADGTAVGYGYHGSPNNQNRSIQEATAGFTRVFRKGPSFGTFQFSGQYSRLVRHPSYVASGQPASANLNVLYLSVRYILPTPPAQPE